jgi:hypothetical protein
VFACTCVYKNVHRNFKAWEELTAAGEALGDACVYKETLIDKPKQDVY